MSLGNLEFFCPQLDANKRDLELELAEFIVHILVENIRLILIDFYVAIRFHKKPPSVITSEMLEELRVQSFYVNQLFWRILFSELV